MNDLLLIVSILPVIVVGGFIYKKDNNKEPTKLLIKLFFGGVISIFITLILTAILYAIFPFFKIEQSELNLIELILSVFIGIALIEEFSKWIVVYTIGYKHEDFDEFYDSIVYGAFVALGFAALENILYVSAGGIGTGIVRAILAVPGHAFDGVFMGYYIGLAKISSLNNNKKLEKKNLILSLLVPIILHGIYDYCLMSGKLIFILVFFVFIICLYIFAIKKVNKVSSIKGKIKYKDNFCPNCGTKVESDFCPMCGRKHE